MPNTPYQAPDPMASILPLMEIVMRKRAQDEQSRIQQAQLELQGSQQRGSALDAFLRNAPDMTPEDRVAFANHLAPTTGAKPEELLSMVGHRPVSTKSSGDKTAEIQGTIMNPLLGRIGSEMPNLPPEVIQGLTKAFATNTIAGMTPGKMAQDTAMSNLGQPDLSEGLRMGMGLHMTAAEKDNHAIAMKNIERSYTEMGDTQAFRAAQLSLSQAQLALDAKRYQAEIEGKKTKAGEGMTLTQKYADLLSVMKEANQINTPEMKHTNAAIITSLGYSIGDEMESSGVWTKEDAKKWREAFAPDQTGNHSPSKLQSALRLFDRR